MPVSSEIVTFREDERHPLLSNSVYFEFLDMKVEEHTAPRKEIKHVCDMIGDWGWWQINLVTFSISVAMFSAFNNLTSAFYAPTIPFECDTSAIVSYIIHVVKTNNYFSRPEMFPMINALLEMILVEPGNTTDLYLNIRR